ncbi:helix-turn-helix domain-containing protein [Leptospira stimsonii]|uniref:XRE family transcriptional regulator n=1 Tax=Leptospira stimsonii TaxID=2202203 RepID=A0ABY2N5I7_9LEPT|nr:helix-turn-helix transcriptional regulator [Leptospira stimsonii]TGK10385.1 XRE family transcriptional regulator [Leptospira stimsonii]TGM17271.1 XRE family transcriptional regulator [Leptospira stimsonii]
MKPEERIEKALEYLKQVKGLTQSKVAAILRLSGATITNLKKGDIELTEKMSDAWEYKLGISSEWLQREIGEMVIPNFAFTTEEKLDILEKAESRLQKIESLPGATDMIDGYIDLSEKDREAVNMLVKHFKNKLF